MVPGSISRLIQEGASSGRESSGGIVISPQTQREVIIYGRRLTVLTTITGILALGEFGSSVMIWRENYPGSLPLAAVMFGVFFLIAAWLLRSGRVTAGAIAAGVLCLFEVVSFPGWQKLRVVQALAGRGLAGDRHVNGTGTFPSGLPGSALTIIGAEVCESFEPPLRPDEHRRNLITRGIELNALVGRDFMIGDVRCCGMRLCEPCKVADRYAARPILRALIHRGGLRADILQDGQIRVGDPIHPVDRPD
jgi:hypothetical protein